MNAMIDTLQHYKGGFVILILVGFLLLERAFPMAKAIGGVKRVARNLSLAGFNAILSAAIVVPLSAAAAGHGLHWRPEWWSGWTGLVLDLLLLDVWIYFWHRLNHEWHVLWRFHSVHHLDNFLDASSALRFHFGEVLLSSLVRAAVIVLAGMPLTSVIVFESLLALCTIFHHSNVKLPRPLERALSLIIVTPSIHWVHHHAVRRDTDSNYSTILSIWDRLFGTRSATERTAAMPIGVEGRKDESLPGLIREPFN